MKVSSLSSRVATFESLRMRCAFHAFLFEWDSDTVPLLLRVRQQIVQPKFVGLFGVIRVNYFFLFIVVLYVRSSLLKPNVLRNVSLSVWLYSLISVGLDSQRWALDEKENNVKYDIKAMEVY